MRAQHCRGVSRLNDYLAQNHLPASQRAQARVVAAVHYIRDDAEFPTDAELAEFLDDDDNRSAVKSLAEKLEVYRAEDPFWVFFVMMPRNPRPAMYVCQIEIEQTA